MVVLKCTETIKDQFGKDVLFTKDKLYKYTPRWNRWSKSRGFVGFTIDDNGEKRWLSEMFLIDTFITTLKEGKYGTNN